MEARVIPLDVVFPVHTLVVRAKRPHEQLEKQGWTILPGTTRDPLSASDTALFDNLVMLCSDPGDACPDVLLQQKDSFQYGFFPPTSPRKLLFILLATHALAICPVVLISTKKGAQEQLVPETLLRAMIQHPAVHNRHRNWQELVALERLRAQLFVPETEAEARQYQEKRDLLESVTTPCDLFRSWLRRNRIAGRDIIEQFKVQYPTSSYEFANDRTGGSNDQDNSRLPETRDPV
ncbi:MAG: hypothetical protein KKA90_02700 [Nanoarchaeota archaeon]|nr:hypothetical protein [Nanoarchaeota archaeon]